MKLANILNETEERNAALNWNAIFADVKKTFGIILDPMKSDAVYILKSGKIIDTKGPYDSHQHENIAKYITTNYGYNDLDDNNGSKFMCRGCNAVRLTPWLNAIYIPEEPMTKQQLKVLQVFISKTTVSEDKPLLIANQSGSQQVEYTKKPKDIKSLLDAIMYYYVDRKLAEDLKDDAKSYFGTTNNPELAFYLNTDGTFLDGSGKALGSSGSSRCIDHRTVLSFDSNNTLSGYDSMLTYQAEGNIRLKPEAPGFEIMKEPTEAQYRALKFFIDHFKGEEFWIDYLSTTGDNLDADYFERADSSEIIKAIKARFTGDVWEDYKEIFDTIWVYVADTYNGGGWDQELNVIDHDISKTIKAYKASLGRGYTVSYNGPGKKHSAKDEKKGFTQLSLFEDTRTTLINKSRNVDPYKDTTYGKNRFERKKYSKVAQSVKAYNQLDMDDFFKHDILTVKIPVTGETDTYTVSLQLTGVLAEIAKNIKSNNNKFEFKTVIQALTKIFNTANIKVNCTCKDFLYNYQHNLIVNNNNVDGTDKDPGPGRTGKTATMKGQGCKHILLALANQDWLMKVASCLKNYITYAEEHMKAAFDKLIFPKLYGIPQTDAIDQGLVDDTVVLATEKHIIEKINDWAAKRGQYPKGSNKNPVTGTGGRTKPEAEKSAETSKNVAEPQNNAPTTTSTQTKTVEEPKEEEKELKVVPEETEETK